MRNAGIFTFFFTFLCDLNFLHENHCHHNYNENKPSTFGKEEKTDLHFLNERKVEGLAYIRRASTLPGTQRTETSPNSGPYLGEGRLQHVTEDAELFEVPSLVSQIFDD